MPKMRLDMLMVERGLVESRAQAQRLIMAGQVRVNGELAHKPSNNVVYTDQVIIIKGPPYVSRGGEKLAAALQSFKLSPYGCVCADVGASTGGFTDCLLQNGAKRVYAIDVGKGILHWKLRQDARVVVMEGTNARFLGNLPERIQLSTIDVSFISLKVVLPVVKSWLVWQAEGNSPESVGDRNIIALIKPQFEAGRAEAAHGDGVIRDPEVHQRVLRTILDFSTDQGLHIEGLIRSPLLGPKGNLEFLAWLSVSILSREPMASQQIETWINEVIDMPAPNKNQPPLNPGDNINAGQD
jgi:23S rRNA (cytidine1920-2'-O)/16S rRNA (cytidine1409-2'-O)-methyltransferase